DHHRPEDPRPRRLQGRRSLAGRIRPQGDPPRRARDAGPHGPARRVRRRPAAAGRADQRLAAHDDPDRRADRDAHRARRRRPLGLVQHLLDAGSRRGRHRGRPSGHAGGAAGRPRLRLEGRDARGVLVVHRAHARVARPGRHRRRPQHDPRRRRRRHAARPQGRRVRGGRRGPGSRRRRFRGVPRRPLDPAALARRGSAEVDPHRQGDQGRHRGDDHRRAPSLPDVRDRSAAVPGDQRQRLGHQVEVRQPLWLPPLAGRRHQPRHRRDARRQDRGHLRLRRRRQGQRGVPQGPGRARHRHRDRPHLRAAGRHGGLPGPDPRGRRRDRRHLRHRDRQQGHHHRRAHVADEAPGDRRQHRPLRQRDRDDRARADAGHPADQHQAAGRRVGLPRRSLGDRALRGPPAEPRQRDRSPELRDVELLHQPDDRPDRAVHQDRRVPDGRLRAAQAPRREGRPPAPRRPRGPAHRALRRAGRLHRRSRRGPLQARPLPVL
ncbi:MAG: Adenosylhomocysteinase, partial [uncultured Solirubrobacteraceae bacterium]